MANLNKKIYELSDDDLMKLRTIKDAEECASEVAALRICIREAYKWRCDRAAQSLLDGNPKTFQVMMRKCETQ